MQIYQEIADDNLSFGHYSAAPVHPQEKNDKTADWIFVIDTLNFCFWSRNKKHWQITWQGETYSGYFALCAAIKRAIEVNNSSKYTTAKKLWL